MNDIPPLAWIAIGVIVIIFIGVNASLIALLRDGLPQRPTGGKTARNLQKVTNIMRNPYEEENQQLQELSHLVHDLKEKPPQEPTDRQL